MGILKKQAWLVVQALNGKGYEWLKTQTDDYFVLNYYLDCWRECYEMGIDSLDSLEH